MIFYSTSIYSFIISFVQSLYSWECVFILLDLTKIRIVALELVPVLSNVPNTTLLMKIVGPLPLNSYNEAPQLSLFAGLFILPKATLSYCCLLAVLDPV